MQYIRERDDGSGCREWCLSREWQRYSGKTFYGEAHNYFGSPLSHPWQWAFSWGYKQTWTVETIEKETKI